ncbi:MAG: ribosome-associated translation inhibitor RaiA [bacterium]
MNIQFYSQNIDLPANLKSYARKKISKALRFCSKVKEARLEFEIDAHHSHGDNTKKVFLTIYVPRDVIRVEEFASDFQEAIDLLIPKLKLQIKKYKEKQQTLARKNGRMFKKAIQAAAGKIFSRSSDKQFIPQFEVVKRKEFSLAEVMNEEQAIEEMNKLGHDFFVFNNAKTSKNAVVYKRKDGKFGIINVS